MLLRLRRRSAADPVIDREASVIADAVQERGAPVERHRLAALVRAGTWGRRHFRRALKLAIQRGQVVPAGRNHVAPPGQNAARPNRTAG